MSEPSGCPDENAWVRLAAGGLEDGERRLLEQHLDGCADCRQAVGAAAAGDQAPLARSGDLLQLGRYRIQGHLGSGGMGDVYEAWDDQLKRRVALKVLTPALSGDPAREARLEREAQAMAQLQHPNVLAVHDVGHADGRVFVAMERVDGPTLGAWAQGRPAQEVLAMFVQAGRGLAAAHAAGLVHRDFKPENVLVGADGRARVMDFGLVTAGPPGTGASAPPGALEDRLTREGTLVGTPAYMAPEQLAGRPADARSDQFSYCASLVEALWGRPPFPAQTVPDRLAAMRSGLRLPPRPGLPRSLRRALERGLSFEPERRFASLEALLGAAGTAAARSGWWALPVALAAVALLGFVAAWATRSTRQPAPSAVAPSAAAPSAAAPEQVERWELRVGEERSLGAPGVDRIAGGNPAVAEVVVGAEGPRVVARGAGATSVRTWSDGVGRSLEITVRP